jgi:hypothetical protein
MRTCAEETLALEFQKKNAKSSRAKQRLNELEQLVERIFLFKLQMYKNILGYRCRKQ